MSQNDIDEVVGHFVVDLFVFNQTEERARGERVAVERFNQRIRDVAKAMHEAGVSYKGIKAALEAEYGAEAAQHNKRRAELGG
jgi:hypothetical protein